MMKHPIGKFLTFSLLATPFTATYGQTTVISGTVAEVRGPSDLDLTGEFAYAVNFSPNDPPVRVAGLTFTPDTTVPEGASFILPNNVAPWQTRPDFGTTADEIGLARLYEDIRWANAGAGEQLEAHLPVTPGQTYKLQVLFYGNAAENRSWDILVEGEMSVDQVTSLGISTVEAEPFHDPATGLVFTQQFTAGDNMLDLIFNQTEGAVATGDVNPIWQALTLEHIVTDTDNDGLPDSWETATFGSLAPTAAADTDNDGVSNAVELNLGTNGNNADSDGDGLKDGAEIEAGADPLVTDSDGDGLSDGAEVSTHHTNPVAVDTDLDGLPDGEEINTTKTNPVLTDSDGDDYPDGVEVSSGTNPASNTSFPLLSSFTRPVTGADAGEGLDLAGTFKYAFNVGPNGAPGLIRGVDFTDESNNGNGGITISNGAEIAAWFDVPDLGISQDDLNLSTLMWSIRHSGANGGRITVTMTGLTPGKPYKLQLLFMERCCQRAFDILVDGNQKLDDFAPVTFQDGTAAPTRGSVAVVGFLASGSSVEVVLDGADVALPAFTDHNPILNGVTLEELTGADADGDGLQDLWETTNFGNLEQNGGGDFDNDGLTNLQENQLGTDPKDDDSDNDGLKDGAEVTTHKTNPKKADTDDDGLSDSQEILTLLTNPLKTDTDGDDYTDSSEVARGTDPVNPASYPLLGTSVGIFTGGDPGEGLDLSGSFLYAFNVGSPGAAPGPVGDAPFTSDAEAGITVTTVNDIPSWITPDFGDTPNDDNLEFVMQSIRWSAAPDTPMVDLTGLTPGKVYKLQLLFAEISSQVRGYDILVDGTVIVHNFFPFVPQLVSTSTRNSVVTLGFVAKQDTLSIVLDGNLADAPTLGDRNPILSGVTLETLNLPDTDGDSLPDVWEMQFLGNLTSNGAADTDGDGVANSAEYAAGTHPGQQDTDGDGLNDKAEITAGTNPVEADTDRDGLSDGMEVNTLHTSPVKADTDDDTFSDSVEHLGGSNPSAAASLPALETAAFTGGDPGEGLDLSGTFLYAFNLGTNAAGGQAGDAVFTADNAPGITFSAPNEIGNWAVPEFGDTPADDVLEGVATSIRWANSPTPVRVNLAGLTPGSRYKTQLLFFETGTNRGFNVVIEGVTIAPEFSPGSIQGNTTTQGAFVSFEFTAPDAELNIMLNGAPTQAADKNPTLSGVTLEALSPAVAANHGLSLAVFDPATGVTFTAQGTAGKVYALDYSPGLTTGTWVEVNDNVVIGAGGTVQVTDNAPAHRTPGKGFWRLRDASLKPQP